MITVPTFKALKALPLSEENEIAYVSNEDRYYILETSGWVCSDLIKAPEPLSYETTQYDLNKQIIGQLPPLKEDSLQKKIAELNQWLADQPTKYFMLLCKELSYYTIIHINPLTKEEESFGEVIIDCLRNIGNGDIFAIDVNEDNAIEAWIKCEEEVYCAVLFRYDNGVVEVKGVI